MHTNERHNFQMQHQFLIAFNLCVFIVKPRITFLLQSNKSRSDNKKLAEKFLTPGSRITIRENNKFVH
jgi:hypothetical protein